MTTKATSSPTWTPSEAIQAMQARLQGVYDDPQLLKLGPLLRVADDFERILKRVAPDPVLLAVGDIPAERLATLPAGSLATALAVVDELAASETMEGFDLDDEVDGGDAVDELSQLWPLIRAVVPYAGDHGDEEEEEEEEEAEE